MSRKQSTAKLRKDGQKRMGPPRPNTAGHCGRPTRDGTPCGRELHWYETACHQHATPAEQAGAAGRLRAAQSRIP